MNERGIRQIPLLDEGGHVVDIVLMQDLVKSYELPLKAVIMAGGFGKRLLPLTEEVPKPMLPVGDKPILELIVNQLQNSGIRKVQMTTHYKPEVIKQHFGAGEKFGLEIQYVNEDQPLGTAGALGSLEKSDEPMLVLNGDILTQVDFRAMLAFHRENQAELTVAVRKYDFQVPYGVIQCDGAHVMGVDEKPTYNFFVNAGIYLLEPSAHRSIPLAQRFDMTDLIEKLTAEERRVVAFPVVEYWMDIGRQNDYVQAQQDIKRWEKNP
jgi:NDP-sugar pyrophosphorylase family protein